MPNLLEQRNRSGVVNVRSYTREGDEKVSAHTRSYPGSGGGGGLPAGSFIEDGVNLFLNLADGDYKLGTLNAEFESRGDPDTVGFDSNGGYSYGTYQIATQNGTMSDYIKYLEKNPHYRKHAEYLKQGGGFKAAKRGTATFRLYWSNLCKDKSFVKSQSDFIIDQKLGLLLKNISGIKGLNLEKRHPVVKDAFHSIATHHGENGGKNVAYNALGSDVSHLSDRQIVSKLYDERSNVDRYFRNSKANIKEGVRQRMPKEKAKALNLLNYHYR